jgi:sulfatase maturation enzyme AslB (radical SAM superfamily)
LAKTKRKKEGKSVNRACFNQFSTQRPILGRSIPCCGSKMGLYIAHATFKLREDTMLIRVTNKCTMGCRHCMIEASAPDGEHMTSEMFEKALDISSLLYSHVILLSGGEPFEHPRMACSCSTKKNDSALKHRARSSKSQTTSGTTLETWI